MTVWDYLGAAVRVLCLGLVVYGLVRAVVKPLLRRQMRRRGRLAGRRLAAYSDWTRAIAVAAGFGLGMLPDVWEPWTTPVWRGGLGIVAGSLSVGLHHAVEAALPAAVARLLTGDGLTPPPTRGVDAELPGEAAPEGESDA